MSPLLPRRYVFASFAVALLAAPAAAATTPRAQEWLDKMASFYERGPFTADYTAAFDLGATGMTSVSGRIDGHITYGDPRHMRMEIRLEIDQPPGLQSEGDVPVEMKISSVSDGNVTWTEVEMPSMGSKQVMKMKIDDEMVDGQLGMGGLQNIDPISQLEAMARIADFEVVAQSQGRVTLRGRLTGDAGGALAQLRSMGVDSVTLVLDAETGAPVEMRAGEEPKVRMEFRNLKRVELGSLPEGTFEYRPPEGVPVIDLAAMVGAQAGRPSGR